MFRASRDFVTLSLDGSREVDSKLDNDRAVTIDSQVDHYIARPTTEQFEDLTLLQFIQKYRIPKRVGDGLIQRRKNVVVICRPYFSPDPSGSHYEQYCKQKLMMYQPFRQLEQLLEGVDNYAAAYSLFLQSGASPPSLADDIHRLEAMERTDCATNLEEEQVAEESNQIVSSTVQDWMLLCQHTPQFLNLVDEKRHVDWSLAAKTYENLDKMPHFIAQHRQFYVPQHTNTVADPERLQGNQLHAYNIVREHFENGSSCKQPLRMIVSGTAGTGKSYLIQCLKRLLGNGLRVAAPTGGFPSKEILKSSRATAFETSKNHWQL
ncbi:uncharacterized protein LOC134176422 [Corticium candelabrum]|uniref:uncharacterized protein LOC134176422 n=1 Tax=Corticium candelabrum TaxID=121492 RepID=UPI002E274739|nr:uncharacterized protein LOC134176422 [Corticium candelabrum]